ncbi:flippase-like domain-containing protein [bacterium]|nr:flippase-like domain-containing protein [bacterium]MDY3022576.1 lysylphosphatidylglycerol synthase transmembrane domain-containing protein [Oliverpabstia sp.]MDY3999627.1 lysylphosphatidylglycerol synthase transmembrane domain-containing protein [Blautia sp.]
MNDRKNKYQIVLFASVMLLTFYAVFQKKDLFGIWNAIIRMELGNFIIAISLGLFFVSAEGITIWYLLVSLGNKCSIWRCIKYSFIGFFYSGITPSATGGQPVQLYYMKRDGYKTSDSSVILMTVALAYKLVLVLIGVCLFFLWYRHLKYFMKDYIILYFVGLFLNFIVVLAIFVAMRFPNILIRIAYAFEKGMIRMRIWNVDSERKERIQYFVQSYDHTVKFMVEYKRKLLVLFIMTMLQRCSLFLLTYIVYRGFHLSGSSMFSIMSLQAAVCISVDMLPVPGAQGITELVYQTVFVNIFTKTYLFPSMLIIRGINFYFLLFVCGVVTGLTILKNKHIKVVKFKKNKK